MKNKAILSYASLAFALSFIGLPIYIYLPNYYFHNYNLDLKIIALILFLTRFVDAIQDPFLGIISDKFSHLKKKIIVFSCPFLGLSFFFLFNPIGALSVYWWLIIFLIIVYSIFSLIYINYQSYCVSFTQDYNFKTKIISFREMFFIFGIITAASLPSVLVNYFTEKQSFFILGIFFLFLILFLGIIFYYFAPNISYQNQNSPLKISNIFAVFKNDILKKFFLIFLFNSISSSIPAALILFFIEDVLKLKNFTGLFMILYFLGLLVGTIFWTKISKIYNNKAKPWLWAMIFASITFSFCYFLEAKSLILYAIICFLSGFGFGSDFCLGYSILTDIIQKYKLEKNESVIFGIANFIIKISLAISSAILIYFIGYFSEISIALKEHFITISYAILPILFRIISAILIYLNLKKL